MRSPINALLRIGRRSDATFPLVGEMSESIVYNRALTTGERLRVSSYLAIKYGTTISGGTLNYVDSTG